MANNSDNIDCMEKQLTKANVFKGSYKKVRGFAKRMGYTIPEAYEALATFGIDALERQKELFNCKIKNCPEAHESGE